MQDRDLGIAGIAGTGRIRGGDQRGCALQHRRERKLVGARQAHRIIEQLADQELHAIRPQGSPAREAASQLVEDLRPARGRRRRRQARQLGDQLGRDVLEDRGIQLFLAREVIDARRVRDPRGRRDVARARAVKATAGQELLGCGEDAFASALALGRAASVGHRKPYDRTRKAVRVYEKPGRAACDDVACC